MAQTDKLQTRERQRAVERLLDSQNNPLKPNSFYSEEGLSSKVKCTLHYVTKVNGDYFEAIPFQSMLTINPSPRIYYGRRAVEMAKELRFVSKNLAEECVREFEILVENIRRYL